MASDQFLKSRERGKVGQKILVDILSAWGLDPYEVPDGYFPDWDLKISTGKTIEVKNDIMAERTGNMALELDALDHSKADILAISYGTPIKCFYLLPMDQARDFAHSWPHKIRGGEYSGELALIKRSLFIEQLNPQVIDLYQENTAV